jgi:hypothetical protein
MRQRGIMRFAIAIIAVVPLALAVTMGARPVFASTQALGTSSLRLTPASMSVKMAAAQLSVVYGLRYQIKNADGQCLDADSNHYYANGDNVQLWGCNNHGEQSWEFDTFTPYCEAQNFVVGVTGGCDGLGGPGHDRMVINCRVDNSGYYDTRYGPWHNRDGSWQESRTCGSGAHVWQVWFEHENT